MGATQSAHFPYIIGDIVPSYTGKSIWTLHKGTKKDDGSSVSIFNFDIKKAPDKLDVAKNGFKRAKTIRHPNVLTFLDGLEMETNIYIVTEEVCPLDDKLEECREYVNSISWGLYQVTKAVSFINNDCNLVHGNISTVSIFLTKAGDWKLGGLSLVCDIREPNCILKNHHETAEKLHKPPEVMKGEWSQIHATPAWCIDVWMLGCLIFEVFNGKLVRQAQLQEVGKIPKSLQPQYLQIFTKIPQSRLNPKSLLDSKYFSNNFVDTCVFLENITLKDNFEKENFFKKLDKLLDEFPSNISKYKILPHLITALDFGSANPRVLGPLLKIGSGLTNEEYTQKVTPSVVKWFGSNDRALRINLLENLEHFAHHLTSSLINDQIFPSVVTGFTDVSPILRELTVKSMLHLVPKMSERVINTQMLKYFAKLQMDQEPGIRTNTTICLGKISQYLSDDTRKRVLVPAFSRALRDPFPPARIAGLMAFTATKDYFDKEDCATKIIPVLAAIMIDSEKQVRTVASQAVKLFIGKLEKLIEAMGDGVQETAPGTPQLGTQDSGMLGWAFTTLSKKIYGEGENPSIQQQSPPTKAPLHSEQPTQQEKFSKPSSDGWDDENNDTPKTTHKSQSNKRVIKEKPKSFSPQPVDKSQFDKGWDDWEDTKSVPSSSKSASGWDDSEGTKSVPGAKLSSGWDDSGNGWDTDTKATKDGWDDGDDITDKGGWNDQESDKKSEDVPKGGFGSSKPKVADGWDDDDWEEFIPKTSKTITTEPKLTRMELKQLKKEEQQTRRGKIT